MGGSKEDPKLERFGRSHSTCVDFLPWCLNNLMLMLRREQFGAGGIHIPLEIRECPYRLVVVPGGQDHTASLPVRGYKYIGSTNLTFLGEDLQAHIFLDGQARKESFYTLPPLDFRPETWTVLLTHAHPCLWVRSKDENGRTSFDFRRLSDLRRSPRCKPLGPAGHLPAQSLRRATKGGGIGTSARPMKHRRFGRILRSN